MSRPVPKFAVGEEVIVLEGRSNPNFGWTHGGEGIIAEVAYLDFWQAWGYHITGYNAPGCFCVEKWLRKKPRPDYTPADEEFTDWMRGITRKAGVEA